MAEQTFRSPNYYDREIDQSTTPPSTPNGVPAGVIGTSNKGPAFVPVTVGNFAEFEQVFGPLDSKKFGPFAVNEFLKHRTSLTYLRVLGAGANSTSGDIDTTSTTDRVVSAGFKVEGSLASHDSLGRHNGCIQFLCARHNLQTNEAFGMPMFTDNNSYAGSVANLVRGMVVLASGSRMMVLDGDQSAVNAFTPSLDDAATVVANKFKLVISSSLGTSYSNDDGQAGIRIYTASLDPTQPDYFAKVLNTNPDRFVAEQHYLYADFPVDDEIATAAYVGVLSGSANTSKDSGETSTVFRNAFGAFDTRYKTPTTSWFISQPFGTTEYDLFRFEALDDGEYANKLYKISITNLKASIDEAYSFGTFTVQIRSWNDTDANPEVLEQWSNCSLDPNAENYVARVIGDRKVFFNFDATVDSDKHVVATGKYQNNSKFVRIIMKDQVDQGKVPEKSLPFGFRGPAVLKTNDLLTDTSPSSTSKRLAGSLGTSLHSALSGSLVPPVPFRFKITKGEVITGSWAGNPGPSEQVSNQLYWGVKFERNTLPLNANLSAEKNQLLSSFTKMLGLSKLDVLVTGSGADILNQNKFTLAKVALSNQSTSDLTSSIVNHMKETAYVRNGVLDSTTYTLNDGTLSKRVTFATILSQMNASTFNTYSPYMKFTNFMYGGFDGLNILDKDMREMNDKSTSFDADGGAESNYVSPGMLTNLNGSGQNNANVKSYMTAIDVMTDKQVVNINLLAVPGIREQFITDYALRKVKDYGFAYYVMDIPSYSDSAERLYDDDTTKPDVAATANSFDGRSINNNYGGTYWPNVIIENANTGRRIKVPASVAAMGALAFNDRVTYPWFAPAGFNRASLDFVKNVEVRLDVSDRDRLYDSRINPIATFPKQKFVIFGQKTLQVNKSALDRVNVRRLLLEVKRVVSEEAKKVIFENNPLEVRTKFVADATFRLGLIQTRAGIESFSVVCNETNNTAEDEAQNRMNGRIVIVPTRVFEFISVDFIITNNGVDFI